MNQTYYTKQLIQNLEDILTETTNNNSISITGIPAVTLSGSSNAVNATCSGTVGVTSSSLTDLTNSVHYVDPIGNPTFGAVRTHQWFIGDSNLKIAVGAGTTSNGTQRVCISNDDVNLQALHNCCDSVATDHLHVEIANQPVDVNNGVFTSVDQAIDNTNHWFQNNVAAISGVATNTSSGTIGSGTQRICIATDDVNVSAINTSSALLADCVVGGAHTLNVYPQSDNALYVDGGNGDTLGVANMIRKFNVSAPGTNNTTAHCFPVSGSGNINADPTYFSLSNGHPGACPRVCIATDDINLAKINAILTDVWDSTNHYLKVHTIP